MPTVSDLTESELIARIQRCLPPRPGWLLVGIGDDAAVVAPERNCLEVLTVDAIIEGIHFDRRFTPPDAIGHRALAVNLSDLAAMGAAPRFALLSLVLPADLSCADFDAMVAAVAGLAARHRLHVIGGNLTRSPGPLMLDVTAAGSVKARQVLTRSGARPGDELYVTGAIGGAAAGLEMLRQATLKGSPYTRPGDGSPHTAAGETRRATLSGSPETSLDASTLTDTCITRYLYPEPRVRAGLLLARNRAATACVDLSDGLADGVWRIAEASGVGVVIDGDSLPLDPSAREWFAGRGADPLLTAVTGGDDYELLCAVRPRLRGRLKTAARHGGVSFTRVGVCTEDRAVVLRRGQEGVPAAVPLPRGYTHFR
jgi:thiamine-monophosphate kinase